MSIAHEMEGRIRLRANVLGNPALDIPLVEAGIEAIDGVQSVRINQKAKNMVVRFDQSSDAKTAVLDTLNAFSHTVFCAEEELSESPDMVNVYWTGTMWVVKMFLPMGLKPASTIAGALPVFLEGIETLITRGLRVEVLDAAVIAMLIARKDYLTAGSLNFLLTLGHYLEQSTEYKSDKMLKSLIKPDIDEVWIMDGGAEKKISVNDLRVGDFVVVGSGEMIPVDGELYSGEGFINQASITGESLPVNPEPGAQIYSGTVVVEGRLVIRAESVGSDTTTARIAKFISNSLKNKSKTETKAFHMANKMVPVTFAIGLGVLAVTKDFRRASSVLSVDYSCALQLVTPTAIKASMYKAAAEGIFIKGAQALENLSEVNTVIFDKTGTLTKGVLSVTDIAAYNGFAKEEVLRIAASAEEHYSHPIASAVVAEAENRGLELDETGEVDFIIAHGVSAYVGDYKVLVGSHHFIAEDENIICCFAEEKAQEFRSTGQSVLYVAIDGELCGIIAMRDIIRDEAAETISELKKCGINRVVMLTGDHRYAALNIASELGIDDVYYELKPEDKADIVKKLKEEGCVSAFVGDGVNDAPALLSAYVGISLPEGADLARETAQVLLLRDDLRGIAHAKKISDETMRVIKRVFKANVGINTATVLMSVMGLLSPLQSALLHNGTTVSTLLYALSLSSKNKGTD